jgi:hypothetical protein
MQISLLYRGFAMNRAQKINCFNLLVTALSTGASLGAVILLTRLVGMPKAWLGIGFMGLMGLMALGPLIFRNQKEQDNVVFDERDVLIYKRVESVALWTTYAFLLTFCAVILNKVGMYGQVRGYIFLILVGGGLVVLMFAKALALIIQYGWKGKDNE